MLYSLLTHRKQDFKAVLVGLHPCTELTLIHWSHWKNNSLILLPQTQWIAKDLQLNIDSRVYILSKNYQLLEMYKLNPWDKSIHQQAVGFINTTVDLKAIDNIWERRKNLSGIHLNITYVNKEPYSFTDRANSKITGYLGDLFLLLQEYLQFDYTLTPEFNGIWGSLQSNGTYDGVMGMLQNGESNWSISPFSFSLERSEILDFSMPVGHKSRRLVTQRPKDDLNWTAYTGVFSHYFWLAILLSIMVLSISLFFTIKNYKNKSMAISTSFTFTITSILGREIATFRTSMSSKILMVFILCWGFIISSSYNAVLTSVLAASKITPMLSFEDLLNSEKYSLVLHKNGAATEYFKSATDNETGKYLSCYFIIKTYEC